MATDLKTLQSESIPVKFNNIVKRFVSHSGQKDFFAVKNVTLNIEPGQLVTVLGPSGCGKTTTLRMLAGFEMPTSGQIMIGDQDVTHTPPNKRNVGMVFQSYALFPHLTVFENVAYGLQVKKVSKTELLQRVQQVLMIMNLLELKDRMPASLSGGQQQRVALARAVVTEPKVLLFDEPLSNLDAKLREYMRDELRKIQQRLGITSLYVTHDQAEAMAISDKVVIMNKGEIEQMGTPWEIYAKPTSRFVADFMGKANFLPATVRQVEPSKLVLDLMGEILEVEKDQTFPVKNGNQVTCVIRPEFWHIDAEGKLKGKVTRATYLGNYVEYEVSLNKETIVVVDYQHYMRYGFYREGDDVQLSLKKERISILP
ncbi:ABC transporter ATP-binding protein [Paenibacillus radicis (ex Xue et al. 2023)]|uniref:Spermidine/putrescine import ATP-binding protein PotA n=1 Tax=Paenibacillus radicis (ex Xue et al. 2023) TaxID=2972489 RepID=A0ABT1YI64_9BACL|nr:ABC transporter ATP-binding protein [Paenibacillus radicis (ex Xue et al. 2023)]MCR8632667.1 ABC transporter ATP-binding protein [Paenibacillus radicis (ex Xue et al. 2023)]